LCHEQNHILNGEKFENSFRRLAEPGSWVSVDGSSMGVFSDETPVHGFPPSCNIDVLEVDVIARVSFVATDDTWWQETTVTLKIPDGNVSNIDVWLGLAPSEWVGHAAGTSTIRLLLLLWTNVNVVPNWEVDLNVFVKNVFDLSIALPWVSLDVNSLKWIFKVDFFECNSSDARM
jgi:hypothetical protein